MFECGIGRSWKPDGQEPGPEAAYPIGGCSKEDQPRAESAMGKEKYQHSNRCRET